MSTYQMQICTKSEAEVSVCANNSWDKQGPCLIVLELEQQQLNSSIAGCIRVSSITEERVSMKRGKVVYFTEKRDSWSYNVPSPAQRRESQEPEKRKTWAKCLLKNAAERSDRAARLWTKTERMQSALGDKAARSTETNIKVNCKCDSAGYVPTMDWRIQQTSGITESGKEAWSNKSYEKLLIVVA